MSTRLNARGFTAFAMALTVASLYGCQKEQKHHAPGPSQASTSATATTTTAGVQKAAPSPPSTQAANTPPSVPPDPLAARYTPELQKCLSTGDAANGVTMAMVQCTDDELAIQDARLNATYKTTMASLDPDQRPALLEAQRAWIKYRDAECAAESQNGGTVDQVMQPGCILEMTVQRTVDLEKMQNQ